MLIKKLQMNETKFCTKIVCEMKPISRKSVLINSYCEFDGSRTDLMVCKT